MIRRPPRSTRTDTSFPTRRSSDLTGPRSPGSVVSLLYRLAQGGARHLPRGGPGAFRSEEHTSELQSLMRTSYAVFCLKKKKTTRIIINSKHSIPLEYTLYEYTIQKHTHIYKI